MGRNQEPDDEALQQALDLVALHGSSKVASRVCGMPDATLRGRCEIARRKGMKSQVDPADVPDGYKLKGTSTLYDHKGNVRLTWVKTKEDVKHERAQAQAMFNEFKEDLPKVKPRKLEKLNRNKHLLSVLPWGDVHFGLYCWKDQVNNDFDVDIARRDLCGAVKYLVEQSPPSDRFLIISLGDFFHSENLDRTTPKSKNTLDMDTRLPKVIQAGVAAFRQAIETALTRHKTVEIICSTGNHDPVLTMALVILLSHVYEKEPRVIVHDEPTFRHYLRHGKCMVGIVHGNLQNEKALPGLMASESPVFWGSTEYRYFYRGHVHHSRVLEESGCIVETFRTLTPGDSYNVGKGYLSGRDMKLIVLHDEYGEVGRTTCSINLLRDL